jgi:pimeloyl-ACP methyl ester carboxylesterase
MQRTNKVILCLHGWRTNSHVMRSQCQDVFNHAGADFTVEYLDAPHDAKGPAFEAVELAFESAKQHGWKEWYDYIAAPTEGGSDKYDGLEASLDFVESEVKRLRPYAICGFSQGGTIASIIAKKFRDEGEQSCEKLLLFCTVPSMKFYNQYPGFIEKPLELRSLHCIGERDPWKDRASYFAEHAFDSSTREVFVHSGNHKPPSIFEKRDGVFDTVAEFLKK